MRVQLSNKRRGYVLMEIVIALGLFAAVSVSLVKALSMTSETASNIQDEMQVERILRSALTDALTVPVLQEREDEIDLVDITLDEQSYFTGYIKTEVYPLEEMENEDGQLLQNMFRVKVSFIWTGADGVERQRSAETWRYGNLYRP